MTKIKRLAVSVLFAAAVTGCATAPDVEEMTQLNSEEIKQLLVGSTHSFRADWGTWREILRDDLTGVGQASGSFPTEIATAVNKISDDGEVCTVYTGEAEWASKNFEYCKRVYTDSDGNYTLKTTKDSRRPERVGIVRQITITPGDANGLLN